MTPNAMKYYNSDINHLKEKPREQRAHKVNIEDGSKLKQIIGESLIMVNTAHSEAVVEVADGISIAAKAPDGVIEAIESTKYKFVLGVQWHPEYFLEQTSPDLKIFKALVKNC
jgi:putative glutamine amidotransferase